MKTLRTLFTALAAALLCGAALAQPAPPPTRPKVALVLSGGGARGFAHIGVLRALREMNVPVDMVVGASMGAVVGGAYSAGLTVEELEDFVRNTDWDAVLADRPPRTALSFRRREDDLEVPSRIEFGIDRNGITPPPAAAGNAALESALARLLPAGAGDWPTGRQPLPFRAVATDLLTGELVAMDDAPLYNALRATLSVPGVFAPVRVNGRLVVDGGLVRNLPVDLARAMGAQVIIAVNVGTPLAGEESLSSGFGVAQQMLGILTEQNVQRSLRELTDADVLISPDLRGLSFLDFRAGRAAIAEGEQAALKVAERLRALAVPAAQYASAESARRTPRSPPATSLPLLHLEVRGTEHARPEALAAEVELQVGQGVSLAQARQAADRLFGRGDFDRVEVQVTDRPEGREVTLIPVEAPWTRSRLRVGLEFSSDFSDDNRFTLSALHVLSWLNPWGGELRTIARLGSQRGLGTQWWQPLGAGSRWFVAPSFEYSAGAGEVFSGARRIARFGVTSTTLQVALGRLLGRDGLVQAGISRQTGRAKLLLPEPETDSTQSFGVTSKFIELNLDSLEPLAFPTRGVLLQTRIDETPSSSIQRRAVAESFALGMVAFRLDEWGGHLYGEWARGVDSNAPLALGGFLRLTGTPRDSLGGTKVLFGRLVLARRIGQVPAPLGGAVRAGISLELGNAFADGQAVTLRGVKQSASAFVSVDTRFGPLYLAAGSTRGTGSSFYIFLGPVW